MADKLINFTETASAFELAKEAAGVAEAHFQASKAEWEEIVARRAALGNGDGGSVSKLIGLARRYGPKAAKYFGYPGLASALTATYTAPEGTFVGESGVLSIILQAFGW
jgi:hypothetical protein|tara:strand:- start:2592 stop:2918 length:327 start_codon:yes stop_codon:yes gene_type:complete